jgi:hypothetical protein
VKTDEEKAQEAAEKLERKTIRGKYHITLRASAN